jgi:S1-C subfamily serine protease
LWGSHCLGLSVATLAASTQLKVGQEMLAFGNPLGNAVTVPNPIVSAPGRGFPGRRGRFLIYRENMHYQ